MYVISPISYVVAMVTLHNPSATDAHLVAIELGLCDNGKAYILIMHCKIISIMVVISIK